MKIEIGSRTTTIQQSVARQECGSNRADLPRITPGREIEHPRR